MIKTQKIDGLEFQYVVVDPSRLSLEFSIGSTVKQLGSDHEVAINFPYADLQTGTPIGRVVVDGETVISDSEKTKNRDLFYVTEYGEVCIGPYPKTPIKWAVQGSPQLLKGGVDVLDQSIKKDNTSGDIVYRQSQRTAVGIREDGTVILFVSKTIMYLQELSKIMSKLGCVDALNGDGGGSSYLWPEDTGWGRKVGAAIVVKKEETEKMKFVIDAGHGPETQGKRCPDDSMREFHFNSKVAEYVVEELDTYKDVQTLTTHENGRDVPLQERTDEANKWKATAFISIHANAFGSEWNDAHGIETFVWSNASRASVALAVAVERNLVQATGLDDRGVKRDDLHVLRETAMPAILCECGFMTNKKEAALLKSDEYRRKCAKAIVKGIIEIYGLKKKEVPVKMPTNSQLPTIQKKVSVSVNGGVEKDAYIINDVMYVPVRHIAESLGASIAWKDKDTLNVTKEDK